MSLASLMASEEETDMDASLRWHDEEGEALVPPPLPYPQ
jgi:hypothetical protein